MYSALLIVSSASAKGMQAVLTDDADRTTAFAWEGSYRTNRTIDQREICVQRRVRFASARLQTCKEISPLSQNYIRLKTGCPIIYKCPWITLCLHRLMHNSHHLVRNRWRAVSDGHSLVIQVE